MPIVDEATEVSSLHASRNWTRIPWPDCRDMDPDRVFVMAALGRHVRNGDAQERRRMYGAMEFRLNTGEIFFSDSEP